MRDVNLAGQCVNCGGSTYGQSECDACADGDSEYTCPGCGDHCSNMVDETEPIKDCFDHIEDGDVRNYARKEIQGLRAEIQKLMGTVKAKDATIGELVDGLNSLKDKLSELKSL